MKNVVILGAGYAGLTTLKGLKKAAKAGVFADLVLGYLEYRAIDHVVLDAVLGAMAREIGIVLAHAVA
mgnify:CR=1 FL=1